MNIEGGIDANGTTVWYVLEGADLKGMFYSEAEAHSFIQNT
jgi:hypothetical protein